MNDSTMRVRTDLKAGNTPEALSAMPENILSTTKSLYATASDVIENSLSDPNALKLFNNFLPPADR
jgi:hypothetical protein